MRLIKPSKVVFANNELENSYNSLKADSDLKKWVKRAIEDIEKNAFCSIPLPKRLIPDVYKKKYSIQNLWKYDLPEGWRLIYTITTPNKVEIISVILDWFDHSQYERRFNY